MQLAVPSLEPSRAEPCLPGWRSEMNACREYTKHSPCFPGCSKKKKKSYGEMQARSWFSQLPVGVREQMLTSKENEIK